MQEDYNLFPKRHEKKDGSFEKWGHCQFFTNLYEVEIDPRRNKFYQYSATIEEVPKDSADVYFRAIKSIKPQLQEKLGYMTSKGQMIWGWKQCMVPIIQKCQYIFQEQKYSYEILIQQTEKNKQLNICDLMDCSQSRARILQVLNIDMKQSLRKAGMFQLGRVSQYYQKDQENNQIEHLRAKGLNVLKGFKFTLTHIYNRICLQIDVCTRVMQTENLYQAFRLLPYHQKMEAFTGATVITKYGAYRTYKVEKIDHQKNPRALFYNEKLGVEMSYQEYYNKAYNLFVAINNQPLLKVVGRAKKQINKQGKLEQKKEYIYLIPEFVSATGMTNKQRSSKETMQLLASSTKLSPTQRVKSCRDFLKKFNQNEEGLIKIRRPKRVNGNILRKPDILFGNGSTRPVDVGTFKFLNRLKNPIECKKKRWIFAYSIGRFPQKDDDDAYRAYEILKKSSQSYGIKLEKPYFLDFRARNAEDWLRQIKKEFSEDQNIQLIICFLGEHEKKYYGSLKNFFINKKVPSQVILKGTLAKNAKKSAGNKILIQINAKLGGVPWEVEKFHPYFKDKTVMYGALSLSKGTQGYTLAFVGTANRQCTKVYSQCKVGIKKKQELPPDLLNQIFNNWSKAFYKDKKCLPDLIIIYRQGITDSQAKVQLQSEIEALDTMIRQARNKTRYKLYDPQLIYVLVSKKTNSRIYRAEKDNPEYGLDFIPRLQNPPSGSVVIEQLSKDDAFDFYLSSQKVQYGTCTPTHYRVAYDRSRVSQQALVTFTYEQCFNYYNWEGAVKVPACLQYSDKLAKLAGQHIKESISGDISKTFFFL